MGSPTPALMLGSLYSALRSAGVDEKVAREAAEEAAECLRPRPGVTRQLVLLYMLLAAYVILTVIAWWQVFAGI